jgi:hypothetical protein
MFLESLAFHPLRIYLLREDLASDVLKCIDV